jgi:hypothetical protein
MLRLEAVNGESVFLFDFDCVAHRVDGKLFEYKTLAAARLVVIH